MDLTKLSDEKLNKLYEKNPHNPEVKTEYLWRRSLIARTIKPASFWQCGF